MLNETALLASPLAENISKIFTLLQGLIGGLFGVYLISVIIRWREYKHLARLLDDIKHELKLLNSNAAFRKKK